MNKDKQLEGNYVLNTDNNEPPQDQIYSDTVDFGEDLAYIEDRLRILEESLQRVEASMTEFRRRIDGGSGGQAVKDLRIFEGKRGEILDAIEVLKIEYVDLISSRS